MHMACMVCGCVNGAWKSSPLGNQLGIYDIVDIEEGTNSLSIGDYALVV
jgi:hypothetical protein